MTEKKLVKIDKEFHKILKVIAVEKGEFLEDTLHDVLEAVLTDRVEKAKEKRIGRESLFTGDYIEDIYLRYTNGDHKLNGVLMEISEYLFPGRNYMKFDLRLYDIKNYISEAKK